jgi:hypothetical protein
MAQVKQEKEKKKKHFAQFQLLWRARVVQSREKLSGSIN